MQNNKSYNKILKIAKYILKHKSTIRKTAEYFDLSKSTIHNYLHKQLKIINPSLYNKTQKLLETNFKEKHIRGGIATKNKYKEITKR